MYDSKLHDDYIDIQRRYFILRNNMRARYSEKQTKTTGSKQSLLVWQIECKYFHEFRYCCHQGFLISLISIKLSKHVSVFKNIFLSYQCLCFMFIQYMYAKLDRDLNHLNASRVLTWGYFALIYDMKGLYGLTFPIIERHNIPKMQLYIYKMM